MIQTDIILSGNVDRTAVRLGMDPFSKIMGLRSG